MRLFLILILILWGANSFFEYQTRHIGDFNHDKMSTIAQTINDTNQLNQYERSF